MGNGLCNAACGILSESWNNVLNCETKRRIMCKPQKHMIYQFISEQQHISIFAVLYNESVNMN